MKLQFLAAFIYATSFVVAAPPSESVANAISIRDTPVLSPNALEKRKGGGGGGGGRGGGGGGSSGGGGGGVRSVGGVAGGRTYSFSAGSNAGGRTTGGSGTPKSFGNRYTGGAVVPYTAGGRSPTRSVAPYALGVGALAFFPGIWLYSVYAYPYGVGYHYYANGQNRTSNVTCLCQEYSVCGCDPDDDQTFLRQVITNNSSDPNGAPVNSTNVRTVDWGNGTIASYINGTLENGTTASGGTDPSSDEEVNPATKLVIEYGGYWVMAATVLTTIMMV